jgi:hypothetical protein
MFLSLIILFVLVRHQCGFVRFEVGVFETAEDVELLGAAIGRLVATHSLTSRRFAQLP